jgi:hypothetical protein
VIAAIVTTPLFFNVFSSRIGEPDKITLGRAIAGEGVGSGRGKAREKKGKKKKKREKKTHTPQEGA